MSSINDVLKDLVNDVDGALACAVVDLESGLMLGAHHTVPYFVTIQPSEQSKRLQRLHRQ
ncbi:MAG: hypothetical protein COW62_12975 [Zetaproteobacteria bacterium CG17_big_fil_post_rev_8_21_14_2_50_50_13]|nr:MAG: hypothetical protein COW62_12975 [Zetaproteobacteria bacterium CG17_big_fil_post_rev_8_21_14_2_50_50_13]